MLVPFSAESFGTELEATMLSGLKFALPMLFITWGTLAVGIVPVLLAWGSIAGQSHVTGQRVIPKALCALTASICVEQAGCCVFWFLPVWICDSFVGHLVWFTFVVVGFFIILAALFMSRERNAARVAVLTGSIAVAVVNVLGFVWLFIGTNASPL
jgi:hypothetical protein